MLLIAWLLVVINQVLIRFADDQSPIIFYITILTYNVNMIEPGLLNWLIFWIVVNPVPIMLWLDSKLKGLNPAEVEIRKPFDHSIMVKDWKNFFHSIDMPKRVLFAFNNPNGQYEVIFDGYSQLYQLPIHVASEKSIHVIPTWYTVEETNYEGSINLWGRDENSIIKNLKNFNSKYVVIYQATNTKLETKWGKKFLFN